jgi:hypothetical protein
MAGAANAHPIFQVSEPNEMVEDLGSQRTPDRKHPPTDAVALYRGIRSMVLTRDVYQVSVQQLQYCHHKIFSSLLQLLTRARNLEYITTEKEMFYILLKVIWRLAKAGLPQEYNIKGPLVDGIWIINPAIEGRVHLCGDETPERLEEIADDWDLTPLHGSKAKFISLLQVSFPFSNLLRCSDEKKVEAALHGIFDVKSGPELD